MAISVPVIWGMGFVVAKDAMSHFSPILLMALRFTLTAFVLIFAYRPPIHLYKNLFWIALVSAAIQYSLTFNGVNGIDASTAALLVQLEVPFGLLMAWLLLGEKITLRQLLGILVAFAGATMILGEPKLEGRLIYAFLVIGGAFTWAIGQVMIKKTNVADGFMLITGVAIFAAPQLFIASAIFESNQLEQIRSASGVVWLEVVYLGIVMTAVGYAIWYQLIGLYSVNRVMPYLLLLPFVSVLGGMLFLGETLTFKIILGGALAILGVAIITVQFSQVEKRETRPEREAN